MILILFDRFDIGEKINKQNFKRFLRNLSLNVLINMVLNLNILIIMVLMIKTVLDEEAGK